MVGDQARWRRLAEVATLSLQPVDVEGAEGEGFGNQLAAGKGGFLNAFATVLLGFGEHVDQLMRDDASQRPTSPKGCTTPPVVRVIAYGPSSS